MDSTNCAGFGLQVFTQHATCSTCNDGRAWAVPIGGMAPYTYTWYTSPLQSSDTAEFLLAGNYSICISDLFGCVACDSFQVLAGNCSAHFNIYPDSILHHYFGVNMASGVSPISYSWNWGDGSPIDTAAYPSHVYATAGFYPICLTIIDGVGCSETFCNSYYLRRTTNTMVAIDILPLNLTALNEGSKSIIQIGPVPAQNFIRIIKSIDVKLNSFQLYNAENELVRSVENMVEATIDISDLKNGIYILVLTIGDKQVRLKVIILRN